LIVSGLESQNHQPPVDFLERALRAAEVNIMEELV